MKIKLLSITGLLLIAFTAPAQNKDMVVTAAGDTIHCEITHSLLGGDLKYRTSKDQKAIKITIDNINAYYIADQSKWVRKIYYKGGQHYKAGRSFMTVLESGKINLYEEIETYAVNSHSVGPMFGTSSTSSYKLWYVAKGNDPAARVKGDFTGIQKMENEFAEFLADNKTVYDMYMSYNGLSFDKLRNLVHLYNTGQPLSN